MKSIVSDLIRVSTFIVSMLPVAVEASQGPGAGTGTASPTLQVAMAFAVYGSAALVIAGSAIHALRKPSRA